MVDSLAIFEIKGSFAISVLVVSTTHFFVPLRLAFQAVFKFTACTLEVPFSVIFLHAENVFAVRSWTMQKPLCVLVDGQLERKQIKAIHVVFVQKIVDGIYGNLLLALQYWT
jgi:hypothetical protein